MSLHSRTETTRDNSIDAPRDRQTPAAADDEGYDERSCYEELDYSELENGGDNEENNSVSDDTVLTYATIFLSDEEYGGVENTQNMENEKKENKKFSQEKETKQSAAGNDSSSLCSILMKMQCPLLSLDCLKQPKSLKECILDQCILNPENCCLIQCFHPDNCCLTRLALNLWNQQQKNGETNASSENEERKIRRLKIDLKKFLASAHNKLQFFSIQKAIAEQGTAEKGVCCTKSSSAEKPEQKEKQKKTKAKKQNQYEQFD